MQCEGRANKPMCLPALVRYPRSHCWLGSLQSRRERLASAAAWNRLIIDIAAILGLLGFVSVGFCTAFRVVFPLQEPLSCWFIPVSTLSPLPAMLPLFSRLCSAQRLAALSHNLAVLQDVWTNFSLYQNYALDPRRHLWSNAWISGGETDTCQLLNCVKGNKSHFILPLVFYICCDPICIIDAGQSGLKEGGLSVAVKGRDIHKWKGNCLWTILLSS